MRRAVLLLAAACVPDRVSLHIPVPRLDSVIECQPGALEALEAIVRIAGGFPDCELDVDASSRAYGTCSDITAGEQRPLWLVYQVRASPQAAPTALAVFVTYVDLKDLSATDDEVEVTLPGEGDGKSAFAFEQSVLDAYPTTAAEGDDPLEFAKSFKSELFTKGSGTLDDDGDGCPNLVELCQGTLFETQNNATCETCNYERCNDG